MMKLSDKNIEIKVNNIKNLPEKMRLMNKNFGGPVCCENFDGANEKGTSAISSDGISTFTIYEYWRWRHENVHIQKSYFSVEKLRGAIITIQTIEKQKKTTKIL